MICFFFLKPWYHAHWSRIKSMTEQGYLIIMSHHDDKHINDLNNLYIHISCYQYRMGVVQLTTHPEFAREI